MPVSCVGWASGQAETRGRPDGVVCASSLEYSASLSGAHPGCSPSRIRWAGRDRREGGRTLQQMVWGEFRPTERKVTPEVPTASNHECPADPREGPSDPCDDRSNPGAD